MNFQKIALTVAWVIDFRETIMELNYTIIYSQSQLTKFIVLIIQFFFFLLNDSLLLEYPIRLELV